MEVVGRGRSREGVGRRGIEPRSEPSDGHAVGRLSYSYCTSCSTKLVRISNFHLVRTYLRR